MSVRRQLAASVAALLLLSVVGAGLSTAARRQALNALGELHAADQRHRTLGALDREVQVRWREIAVARELSPSHQQIAVLRERLSDLDTRASDVGRIAGAEGFADAYRTVAASWAEVLDALTAPEGEAPAAQEPWMLLAQLDTLRADDDRRTVASLASSMAATQRGDRTVLALLVLSVVCGGLVVVRLSLSISRGLARLEHASRRVAEGDYAFRIARGDGDEFATAAQTFDSMSAALAEAIAEAKAARHQAELASAAKSDFLTSMSHDLRTPLTAVIGYADIIDEAAERAGLEAVRADVVHLRRGADVLVGMIGELLDFARLEAGRMPREVGAVDLSALVAEAASTVRPLLDRGGNRLVISGGPCPSIVTDVTKVRHILLNLLGNACKFTQGGRVELSTSVVTGLHPGVILRVSDTGIGMSAAEVARVFSPYEQANPDVARRYGGSGLGLAIAQRFVDLLDGRIGVTSTPGQGTTFSVWLPDLAAADGADHGMSASAGTHAAVPSREEGNPGTWRLSA